eukprot:CAMPEP_0194202684 /NCGR_PEP_ID=MMETSP0156-20130528/2657_1 /TAXON_ID=33649 /ORGANISM="Thalassionema nitzschioides, Strain L26-B" /LENGTH=368 /DNA_ID=CAMNT_0038928259 /DNA_START=60 /DNA_END=1162 /DNA_ORIENTATION=+
MNNSLVHDFRQEHSLRLEKNMIESAIPNFSSEPPKNVDNHPVPNMPGRSSLMSMTRHPSMNLHDDISIQSGRSSLMSMTRPPSRILHDDNISIQSCAINDDYNALSKNNEIILNRAKADNNTRRRKRGGKLSNTSQENQENGIVTQLSQMKEELQHVRSEMELKVSERDDAIKMLERALHLQTNALERLRTENNQLMQELELERERKSTTETAGNRAPFSLSRRLDRTQNLHSNFNEDEDSLFRNYRKGQRLRLDYHANLSNRADQLVGGIHSDGYRERQKDYDSKDDDTEKTSSFSSLDRNSSCSSSHDPPTSKSQGSEFKRLPSLRFFASNKRSSKGSRGKGDTPNVGRRTAQNSRPRRDAELNSR